jgi:hypothetical protein
VSTIMVSALDGERQAHGSQKVSDLEYCELKQVLVKVGFYYWFYYAV